MAAKKGSGRVVTRRLTRGPRKGQTVRGYVGKGGKFTEVKAAGKTKGGAKLFEAKSKTPNLVAGKKGRGVGKKLVDAKGRNIHQYKVNGKTVNIVVKPKPKAKGKASKPSGVAARLTKAIASSSKKTAKKPTTAEMIGKSLQRSLSKTPKAKPRTRKKAAAKKTTKRKSSKK